MPVSPPLDEDKMLNPEMMRINLLLSSLYLSAFEILKLSIIEGLKSMLVWEKEITEDDLEVENRCIEEYRNQLSDLGLPDEALDDLTKDFQYTAKERERYLEQVERYEKEVGVRLDDRSFRGLIPSCNYLKSYKVLDGQDIELVKRIRDHRNKIAHELPQLLVSKGLDVELDLLMEMRRIIAKVEVNWARNDVLLDSKTMDEIDLSEIKDDEIRSGRMIILDLIINSVIEYLNQFDESHDTQVGL